VNRRELLLCGAAAAAGTTLLGSNGLWSPTRARAAGHCLWGVHAEPRGTQSAQSALTGFEKMVGRKMAVQREYFAWDVDLPTPGMEWTVSQGRVPYAAWHAYLHTVNGPAVQWRSIANGSQDARIQAQAQRIKAFGAPMYLCFHHEPENCSPRCGTAADYKAAFEHVRTVFDSEGVTNVTWVMTLEAVTYQGHHGGVLAWEPDPSFYDYVGVDGYNRWPVSGHSYRSFTDLFNAARAHAILRQKPMAIGEFACVEQVKNGKGDPTGKAKWLTNAGQVLESWPEVQFACYSHVQSPGLAYWVNTSASSLAAYKAVGNNAYFRT
jgi:hypothetical protein